MHSYEELKKDESIRTYIEAADATLMALGYTEHSFPHVCRVAEEAANILAFLGYDEKTQELARIAGYLHDIGNLVSVGKPGKNHQIHGVKQHGYEVGKDQGNGEKYDRFIKRPIRQIQIRALG